MVVLRVFVSISLMSLLTAFALASPSQDSSTYAAEYALFEKIQAAAGATQKSLCLEFVKTYKESQLDPNVSYFYSQQLTPLREQGAWEQLATASEQYLSHRPSDQNMAAMATEAYQKLGQPEKLVQFGTRLYNQAPSAGTAYLVAKAYQSMRDTPNFEKWAERTLRHAPNNTEMLVEMVNASWAIQDLAKAAQYAERALKGLESAGPESNRARAFCHRAVGEDAYIAGDFSKAQDSYQKAVEMDPSVDFAHLRLGYCQWRSNRVDDAIRSFARAVALKG
ncbi:MAG: hypothetical protein JSU96_05535 [Acidobacteriota bacterium]|nr:MAG: hypothetical protein JSU96_05535 [Acidobacteriota bacterium]